MQKLFRLILLTLLFSSTITAMHYEKTYITSKKRTREIQLTDKQKDFKISIDFPKKENTTGLQQKLYLLLELRPDLILDNLEIIPVDYSGYEIGLCSVIKKCDHSAVIKVHKISHQIGNSTAEVTFYCKGLTDAVNGCKSKKPSTVKLQLTGMYLNNNKYESFTVFSEPFFVVSNRRTARPITADLSNEPQSILLNTSNIKCSLSYILNKQDI